MLWIQYGSLNTALKSLVLVRRIFNFRTHKGNAFFTFLITEITEECFSNCSNADTTAAITKTNITVIVTTNKTILILLSPSQQ